MSVMTATAVLHVPLDGWTVDDLADLPEEFRYELVDGGLLVSPSPAVRHGYAALGIGASLRAAAPEGLVLISEVDLQFDRRNVRRPDVAVVRRSALGQQHLVPGDVLLVVEVMSPGSISTDRVAKPAQYAEAGIPGFWRLELDERVLVTHVLDGGVYRETGRWTQEAVLDEPFPVRLPVPDLLV